MPQGNIYTGAGSGLDSRDVVADFFPKLEAAMETIWAPQLAKIVPSDRETEEYAWLGQVPTMRKWVGARHEEVVKKYSMTVKNDPFEATLPISVDDLRRDKTGQVRDKVGQLALRAATHWNQIASPLLNTGDAGTNGLAYDGQFFFDTDHNESGTNQSNDLTATEIPSANVADPNIVTATEAANILTEALGYFMTLTDDQGEPINQDITNVVVMVTKATHFSAFNNAIRLNNLTQATDNPVKGTNVNFSVILNTRLTQANTIRLFAGEPGSTFAPLVLQEEEGVTTQLLGPGSEEEFKNNRHVFGVKAVRGVGYGMWQKSLFITLS
jgi:phage major head subunit gpT-like protein